MLGASREDGVTGFVPLVALGRLLCLVRIRRERPVRRVDGALEFGSWCHCSLKVFCVKVEPVLFWANVDQSLSAVRPTPTLECQGAADVHFEIAGAEEAEPW